MWTFWPANSATGARPVEVDPPTTASPTAIRLLIVDGRMPVGARLPSERALADALRVSRTTVTSAYAQMREDGYLNARRGARSTTALPVAPAVRTEVAAPAISLAAAALSAPAAARQRGVRRSRPRCDALSARHRPSNSSASTLLRQAIAERYCARGLPTEPDEIMVTTGALHAIGLILATYTQPGDRVLVEQPTYHGALTSMATIGCTARSGGDDRRRLGARRNARRGAPAVAEPGLSDSGQPQPDGADDAARTTGSGWRSIIAETRTRTIIDETILDMWLDERRPRTDGRGDDDAARSGADRRFDVEVVLGRAAHRLDPRRARPPWPPSRRCGRPSTWARRSLEQLAAARLLARRDELLPERRDILRARRALLLALLERASARLAAAARQRRHVAVGAAARADEHRAVGGGIADGPGDSAGPAVRRRRHAGTVHPRALRAARGRS